MKEDKKDSPSKIQTLDTIDFKLKDKGERRYKIIKLREVFNFLPEIIIVEKVQGKNNTVFVRAVLTKEQSKRVNKIRDTEVARQKKMMLEAKLEAQKVEEKAKKARK